MVGFKTTTWFIFWVSTTLIFNKSECGKNCLGFFEIKLRFFWESFFLGIVGRIFGNGASGKMTRRCQGLVKMTSVGAF